MSSTTTRDVGSEHVEDRLPPSGGGGSVRGRRRLVLAAIAILVALSSFVFVIGGRDSRSGTTDGGPSQSKGQRSAAGNSGTSGDHSSKPGSSAEGAEPSEREAGASAGNDDAASSGPCASDQSILLVGDSSNQRLLATRIRDLLSSPTEGGKPAFPVVGVSQPVGAPIGLAVVGEFVVVAATNHAELVRLNRNLGDRKTVGVKDLLGVTDEIWYGSVVPSHDASRVTVSAAFGSKVAIVELDVSSWTVIRRVVFDDRWASMPRLCRLGETWFLLTTRTVDVLSSDLRRIASTRVEHANVGLACGSSSAWVVSSARPTLTEVTVDGKVARTMRWKGKGAGHLAFDRDRKTIFGTDQVEGKIFGCRVGGGCRMSATMGKKPTDLIVVGNRVVVTMASARAIAILDARSLEVINTVPFTGRPRTLAVW